MIFAMTGNPPLWLGLRSCERKFISQLQQNSIIVFHFFVFQTIISRFRKRFVEMNIFGKEISDVVVRKICLQCWLCFAYIEETLEQNSVRKLLLLTLMMTSFTSTWPSFLPHQFTNQSEHPSLWYYLWHFKSRTREQPELKRPMAV